MSVKELKYLCYYVGITLPSSIIEKGEVVEAIIRSRAVTIICPQKLDSLPTKELKSIMKTLAIPFEGVISREDLVTKIMKTSCVVLDTLTEQDVLMNSNKNSSDKSNYDEPTSSNPPTTSSREGGGPAQSGFVINSNVELVTDSEVDNLQKRLKSQNYNEDNDDSVASATNTNATANITVAVDVYGNPLNLGHRVVNTMNKNLSSDHDALADDEAAGLTMSHVAEASSSSATGIQIGSARGPNVYDSSGNSIGSARGLNVYDSSNHNRVNEYDTPITGENSNAQPTISPRGLNIYEVTPNNVASSPSNENNIPGTAGSGTQRINVYDTVPAQDTSSGNTTNFN